LVRLYDKYSVDKKPLRGNEQLWIKSAQWQRNLISVNEENSGVKYSIKSSA